MDIFEWIESGKPLTMGHIGQLKTASIMGSYPRWLVLEIFRLSLVECKLADAISKIMAETYFWDISPTKVKAMLTTKKNYRGVIDALDMERRVPYTHEDTNEDPSPVKALVRGERYKPRGVDPRPENRVLLPRGA